MYVPGTYQSNVWSRGPSCRTVLDQHIPSTGTYFSCRDTVRQIHSRSSLVYFLEQIIRLLSTLFALGIFEFHLVNNQYCRCYSGVHMMGNTRRKTSQPGASRPIRPGPCPLLHNTSTAETSSLLVLVDTPAGFLPKAVLLQTSIAQTTGKAKCPLVGVG
jgi:hypothetical protein